MSNSPFERFIQQNKEKFDSEPPAGKVWDSIEKNIPVKKNKVFTIRDVYKWSAAAAVLCIILTSLYFLFLRKPGKVDPVAKTGSGQSLPDNTKELSNFSPEYTSEARQIFQAIALNQEELQREAKDEPQLYKEFIADLKVLDSSYQALKGQAALSANKDLIIKAMMDNLRLQAELLGRQLMIISNFKTKTFKNEKSSSQSL